MKPGDLVKMKEGRGFSWWADEIFIILRPDPESSMWVYLLTSEGKQINVQTHLLEVVS